MKALTLHQPHATLVALGVKAIETRSWSTPYRGPLAIHAGLRPPGNDGIRLGNWLCRPSNMSGYELLAPGTHNGIEWNGMMPVPYEPHFGAIVATCTLADVVPIVDGFGPGALSPGRTGIAASSTQVTVGSTTTTRPPAGSTSPTSSPTVTSSPEGGRGCWGT